MARAAAVTGGTGFLGGYVAQALLAGQQGGGGSGRKRARSVRVLSRRPDPRLAALGAEVVVGDICDAAALGRLVAGCGVVYHLAGVVEHSRQASAAEACERVHVAGTEALLRACAAAGCVRRVVCASTSGVVGIFGEAERHALASDEAPETPYAEAAAAGWPYYRTKIEAEKLARRLALELRLEVACVRPSLLLGPGDWRLASCRSVLDLIEGKVPFVPPGGISFVDARDAAAATLRAARAPFPAGELSRTFLLAAHNCSLEEYFEAVCAEAGVRPPWLKVPTPAAWAAASAANAGLGLLGRYDPSLDPVLVEMAVAHWGADAKRARHELGFAPRPPQETLRDTVAWLRENSEELTRRHGE